MLAVVACQALVELVISTDYGLAVVGITVLALLLFHIGAPDGDVGAAIGARLLDTALGAALALLLRRLLWPRATATRLPQVQARAVAGVRRVFAAAWTQPAGDQLVHQRRRLQGELATLRALHADTLADASSSGPPDPRWPISVAVEELSVLALSWPRHRVQPGPADAHRFLSYLDGLAAAAATGAGVPGPGPSTLPGHPRTLAAAGGLADALRAAHQARPGS